jgi:hypothetical protein
MTLFIGVRMENDIAISGRMGRPPLGVKATAVRLSPDALARIDKLEGPHRRAAFIREAVETELERREKAKG